MSLMFAYCFIWTLYLHKGRCWYWAVIGLLVTGIGHIDFIRSNHTCALMLNLMLMLTVIRSIIISKNCIYYIYATECACYMLCTDIISHMCMIQQWHETILSLYFVIVLRSYLWCILVLRWPWPKLTFEVVKRKMFLPGNIFFWEEGGRCQDIFIDDVNASILSNGNVSLDRPSELLLIIFVE